MVPVENRDDDIDEVESITDEHIEQNNIYVLQMQTRDRLRCHGAKNIFCLYEQSKHNALALAIQKFLYQTTLNHPQPGIDVQTNGLYHHPKEKVNFQILLASLDMVNYRGLHFEHNEQNILVTPGLLLEHGFLTQLYIEHHDHIQSFPPELRDNIQLYLDIWNGKIRISIDSIPPALFSQSLYPDTARHNIILTQDDYISLPSGAQIKQIPQLEDIKRYRGAQIASHGLWCDSHLNLLLQSKYFNLYSRRRAIRPKLKIDAVVRMSAATRIVHDQLRSEGLERLERLQDQEDDEAYWENLDDEEAIAIANMMEA